MRCMTRRTTVYLSDEMKLALEREAFRRGCSEAQVIRDAVAKAVSRPRPAAAIFKGYSLSEQVDELLAGFGGR
jgi:predicted transcriptional regulator